MRRYLGSVAWILLAILLSSPVYAGRYKNFDVAVYFRAYEVREMNDLDGLASRWAVLGKQLKVDKVYLETHRDTIMPDEATILKAKRFFQDKGIRTSGGITFTVNERNRFQTFCYTTPEQRQKTRQIVEFTARLFDEVILDDFFFTNCKCENCIKAKGNRTWTQFRLALMEEAGRELVVKPAKAVNPKVQVVVKYPNWYEHFQGLGFNLEAEPRFFDRIYTGTETRDAVNSDQHLQPYLGYEIFRYFENIKPGGNAGGWVDTGGMRYMDRYAEQLWLTLFAKAPEITLFDWRQVQRPLRPSDRSAWQDQSPSFHFDTMMQPILQADGTTVTPTTIARAAGYVFEQVDGFLGKLGRPVGVKAFKPYHSTGEDFLHNYLGMVGIPIEMVPEFPTDAQTTLLTESAKFDPAIVAKIKSQLVAGKNVVITSGLLKALQGKGIEDIVELEYTGRKIATKEFRRGFFGGGGTPMESPIVIPQIQYLTNDAWELIGCLTNNTGYPLLIQAGYAKAVLYVLVIPDDFGDLYKLPADVLTQIKNVVARDIFVRVDAPAHVSLFVYDNDTFIVESFLSEAVDVGIAVDRRFTRLRNLVTGEVLSASTSPAEGGPMRGRGMGGGNRVTYRMQIKPHSYCVFAAEQGQ